MLSIKNKKIIANPHFIGLILDGFSIQIKTIDFFKSDREITQIFNFLKKIVRSKPTDPVILKSFNNVCLAIHYKILSQSIISQEQIDRIEDYLRLLKTILRPQHRYLFDRNEITLQAKSLQEISSFLIQKEKPIPLRLLDILIHDVLKPSFYHLRFLNDYPRLVQAIYFLAQAVDKNSTATDLTSFGIEGNIPVATVASSGLFNTLGTLLYQLRYQAKKPGVLYHLPATVVDFEQAKNRLCRLFKLSVNKDILGSIVYNLFLYPAYKNEPDYLHAHPGYAAQCKSAHRRFSKRYRCKKTAKIPSLAITIEHNNLSKMELIKACHAMRRAEGFVDWLQGLELGPVVNSKGGYLLRIAESKPDFFLDMSYFERDRSVLQDVYATLAYYYPQEMRQRNKRGIQGVTYTYLTYPFVIVHEYLHRLCFFLMGKSMYIDQTSTEGIAELFAGGICHPSYVKQLRFFANDSTMLRTLHRMDVSPETFYAFKWVGYLVNQQIIFFTRLLMLLKQGKKDRFYSKVGRFLDNSTHIQDFLSWSILQAGVCEAYFERYPAFSKRPIIYLRHIEQQLAADLEYNPVVVRKSRSALAVAEKASMLIWNTPTFTQVTTNRSLSFSGNDQLITSVGLHLNQTELSVYKPSISPLIEITISLPLSTLFCGVLSAGLDHIGEINKQAYFYLPQFITYGLKPALFAFISAGINSLMAGPIQTFESKVLSFFVYFAINYSGLLAAQAIYQKVSEKIRNKWLVFFIQTFTWMCLWNPGLLTSEAFFSEAFSSISLSLMQGLFFVLGERGAHVMITHMPSRDHAKETFFRSSKQMRFHTDVVRGIMGTQETDKEASLEIDLLSLPCGSCTYAQTMQSDITFWSRSDTAELSHEDSEDLSIKSCSSDVRRLSSSV